MQKLRSIQILRGIAVIGVVALHALGAQAGAAGVDLFFVISGFIIGKVMVGRAPLSFLADRFWRIFPFYWACSLPWLGVAWITHQLEPGRTIASLFLWPVTDHFGEPYLTQAWSLCYEMLFYYSATIALATGKGRWLIATFFAIFALNLIHGSVLAGLFGYPLILDFLMGLAIGKMKLDARAGAPALGLGILLLVTVPASYFVHHTVGISDLSTLRRVLYWGVPSAMVVYGALSLERHATFRPLIILGDASYAIYLTHSVGILFGGHNVGGFTLSIAIGVGAHFLVEKPLLRLRYQLPRRAAVSFGAMRSYAGTRWR
jgi:exopolysaccharide production protein ExoZ